MFLKNLGLFLNYLSLFLQITSLFNNCYSLLDSNGRGFPRMASLKHNKKRNVGLLNEFFARYMARAIVEKRDNDLEKSKNLFTKHFHKNTELHRELKLFQCLMETKLSSKESAVSLLNQVKDATKIQSQTKLDLEKTALLHEINLTLLGDNNNNSSSFFDTEIPEYRNYATIQVLLNHWRGGLITEDLSEVAQLEDKLLSSLTEQLHSSGTNNNKNSTLNMTNEDVDGLVVNLMNKKLNQKFGKSLNEDQKKLLQLYVFSSNNKTNINNNELSLWLEELRDRVIKKLEQPSLVISESIVSNKIEHNKLKEVSKLLKEDYWDVSNPNDQVISFYMTVSKLEEELKD